MMESCSEGGEGWGGEGRGLRVARYRMLMGFMTQNSWGTPMKHWDRWEASV